MVFDRYILKNLIIVLFFVAVTLAGVVFLTQSLRFLELVMNSGASSFSFWILTFLALPRFFEIILPIALMVAVVFVYNRMTMDSELIVMRGAGLSPMAMARPALRLATALTVLLWVVTFWLAPVSLAQMQEMRQIIKAQYSAFLFREGIFNPVGDNLTIYVSERTPEGELQGLMIHDSREENRNPVTIIAERGAVVSNDEGDAQVIVFEGSRQDFDGETGSINRLDFDRYTIDIPESAPVRQRWREPDERTLLELLRPNLSNPRDVEARHEFIVETNKRIVSPLLALAFALVGLVSLLIGPVDRRGMARRILAASLLVVVLQGLFLAFYNLSRQAVWGLPLMYLLVLAPIVICAFLLGRHSESFRRNLLYGQESTQ
ncbi:MAG: LPS export ABC transporter permease LptF [Alphaproteobacteria bacterium]|nr:LPS export ABC transporter permease LptF [Alphaproteobacteria bacterium]